MSTPEYDYLIVGQGLAGTALAWHLIEAGKRILIVSDSSRPAASLVAAGIYNPLTGRKLVKTWMADQLFPYAADFYRTLERELAARLAYPMPIYRPYRSAEERARYLAYASEAEISDYIEQGADGQIDKYGLRAPFGGLSVKGSGWVDLIGIIERSREQFIKNSQYLEGDFHDRKLIISNDSISWGNIKAEKIIFCQGVDARENSLFGWLPFNPVKGQILDVTFERYCADEIVNQGIFILPMSDGHTYRVGATYSWHDLDWEITDDGRAYLEDRLKPLVPGEYGIVRQRAGLRPSSNDRRPLIGLHPVHRRVGLFNGLGTKGVTLAPYFAREFVQYLENGKELKSEVNIERHYSLYYHL